MSSKIVIVDYGMGNLHSVRRSLERIKVDSVISSNPDDIIAGEKVILPGVGNFARAMLRLKELNLTDALNEFALIKKKPVLGICLGMQLMTKKSEEGNSEGLGWLDAETIKFSVADRIKYKVPHIGWNSVCVKKNSLLMKGVSSESSEFYFLHSYHLKAYNRIDVLNESRYGNVFPSAIEKDNIFAVQYHPEKSYDSGQRILKNFVKL